MYIRKIFVLLLLLVLSLEAGTIDIKIQTNTLFNANALLITAKSKQIKNPKAILDTKEIIFLPHPFIKDTLYALVPFHYFLPIKKHQLIVTYTQKNRELFEGFEITLNEDSYKSEEIKVSSSKVTLNTSNKNRTMKEYKEAMDIYNTVTPDNYWYEDFIFPLESKITSDFGTKRIYNGVTKSYHTGVDFKAKLNTKIIASNNGIVKISKNRFYAGNSIIIDHGHGIYTCYFHLNKMFVKEGDFVQKGDTIALSGNSGRSTGSHLHFATFVNGIQVNPLNLLRTLNSLNN